MEPHPPAAPSLIAQQRAADLHERSRLGGIFYVFSWALVAGFSDGGDNYPVAAVGIALVFVGLMLLRTRIRAAYVADPACAELSIVRQWTVLLATGVLWGGVSGWALRDPAFADAKPLTLIATSSLAMAFAQIFAVDRRLALLGTATVFVPMFAAIWLEPDVGVGVVLLLNAAYLVAVIGRSHREYESRLLLDAALRIERDRFAVLSRTDALTRLANRGHFQLELEAAVAAALADGTAVSLLIADLDHFKAVNDRHGHAGGDRVLKAMAERLVEAFPQARVIARLGGEEFGVLAAGDDTVGLMLQAETFRARQARARTDVGRGEAVAVTVSLGLAAFDPEKHPGADALYAAADEALYRAKEAGRNRLVAA